MLLELLPLTLLLAIIKTTQTVLVLLLLVNCRLRLQLRGVGVVGGYEEADQVLLGVGEIDIEAILVIVVAQTVLAFPVFWVGPVLVLAAVGETHYLGGVLQLLEQHSWVLLYFIQHWLRERLIDNDSSS